MVDNKLFDLSGKVALVTGGSKGIGYAIGKGLAMAGADVILASRHISEAQEAAKSLEVFKVKSVGICMDVCHISEAQTAIDDIAKQFRQLDILVNNAGISPRKPALEVTEEWWDAILDTNLKGTFFCAQAAARQMVKSGRGGRIINISSVGSMVAQNALAPYGASKGGINQLTRVLAVEWAQYNILVNAIAPGSIRTNINKDHLAVPDNLKRNLSKICLGRIGDQDEIAGTAVFLASQASTYITGQTIFVDGGWTIE